MQRKVWNLNKRPVSKQEFVYLSLSSFFRVADNDCQSLSMLSSRTLSTEHIQYVLSCGHWLQDSRSMYKSTLTCRVAPPRNRPWLGWSPGGRRCDSRSCNTRAPSRPAAHLYAASPLCIWLLPSGSQCDWKSESRSQMVEKIIRNTLISVTFVLVALLQKSIDSLHNNTYWPTVQKQERQNRLLHTMVKADRT